jgi:predicted acylesterase/phospholipase RssA
MLAVLNEREDNKPVFVGFLGTPTGFDQATIRNSVTYTFLQSVDIPLIPEFVESAADQWLIDTLMKQPGYRNLFSFVEEGGWYSAHKFVEWLQVKLDTGTVQGQPRHFSQMTLAEFFAVTGIELSVVATDTTEERILVLNHTTAPHCPLVWAVRMSMSIPLLWPEVEWQANWGAYRGRDMAGHLIVDGGLLSNFPLELFLSDQPHVTAVMGPKKSENVLGLLIDESLAVDEASVKAMLDPSLDFKQLRTARRIMRLINTMTQAHDKMVIEAFEQYVARLPAKDYGTTEFDMSDERREALVAAGRKKTREYFDRRSGEVTSLADDLSGQTDIIAHIDRIAARILSQ